MKKLYLVCMSLSAENQITVEDVAIISETNKTYNLGSNSILRKKISKDKIGIVTENASAYVFDISRETALNKMKKFCQDRQNDIAEQNKLLQKALNAIKKL